MATRTNLKAQRRSGSGTPYAKTIRRKGLVPATIYGKSMAPQNLQIDEIQLRKALVGATSKNFVVNLCIEGESVVNCLAIVQATQVDPLSHKLLHVDFHGVSESEEISAEVAVEPIGEAVGVKIHGGIMDQILRKIEVACLPANLPEKVLVDISQLNVGQTLHVGEIKMPEGVSARGDLKAPVFSITEVASADEQTASTGSIVETAK